MLLRCPKPLESTIFDAPYPIVHLLRNYSLGVEGELFGNSLGILSSFRANTLNSAKFTFFGALNTKSPHPLVPQTPKVHANTLNSAEFTLFAIKAAGVACGPVLEGVACGPTLEDAASGIPSSFVACGPVACEDKRVTSLGIP